jgi:effector-binding domain-containing protein
VPITPEIHDVSAYPTAAVPLRIPSNQMQSEFGGAVHALLETPAGRVVAGTVPAGRVAVHVHTGPYDSIAQSWMALDARLAEHGHTPAGDFWEVYEVGPEPGRDPSTWRTVLYRRLADPS